MLNRQSQMGEEFDKVVYLKKFAGMVSEKQYARAVGELFVNGFFETPGLVTLSDQFSVNNVGFGSISCGLVRGYVLDRG